MAKRQAEETKGDNVSNTEERYHYRVVKAPLGASYLHRNKKLLMRVEDQEDPKRIELSQKEEQKAKMAKSAQQQRSKSMGFNRIAKPLLGNNKSKLSITLRRNHFYMPQTWACTSSKRFYPHM